MAECERSRACAFFNNRLNHMPALSEELKNRFCLRMKERCARNIVHDRVCSRLVPPDRITMDVLKRQMNCLYPNDKEKAELIVQMLVQ